jgi:GNAT superfamily N-acetyltransferase
MAFSLVSVGHHWALRQERRMRGASFDIRTEKFRDRRGRSCWQTARMATHPLDNPFFSALDSLHAGIALRAGEVLRYPAEFAPFLGIPHADVALGGPLDSLVPAGESVLMLGVAPSTLPDGWALERFADLAQLTCDRELEVIDGPGIVELDERHHADVLALTALVYPHYFRPRTMALGRYFGMYVDGRLAAMIGERLGTHDAREMSAICTHPDFLGRGLARRLTAFLTNRTLQEGEQPFLHVAYANARAKALYERMGYRLRRDIPFFALRRG